MTYEYADAVYALNSYLNKALTVNLGWTPITYTDPNTGDSVSAKPIIPSQQQPEFLSAGKTFLVYGSAIQPQNNVWGLNSEYVVYTIWSPSAREANATANFIHDLFENRDTAADNVNSWLEVEGGYDPQTGTLAGRDRYISFAAIRSGLIEKAEPAEEENGWVAAGVTIEIMYTKKNHAPQTRFTTA